MSGHLSISKITAQHLERKAIVYLRQSSMKQVRNNRESQRLQYALADRAKELGFREVEIIDVDLGATASIGAARREGFDRVIAKVAVGEVGIVFSREVARLLRTDKDWCRLMEVCQIFSTLIGDEEQIYDLNLTDDQLILGIKGTMSVVELKILHTRMVAGMEAKARRGEMVRMLAPGYIYDGTEKVVKDPDKRVVQAIDMIFRKFLAHRSVRQTFLWFRTNGVQLPVNKSVGGKIQIVWQLPTHPFIKSVLENPFYAGAYIWGRRPMERVLVDGKLIKRQKGRYLRAEECKVCIKDHHEGYISWDTYEENLRIIRGNNMRAGKDESVGAIRAGQGFLAGLLRCGRCGRKLYVRYWGKSGTSPRYACKGEYYLGGKYCLAFGGATADRLFSQKILEVISPLGVEASLEAMRRLTSQQDEKRTALERQLEQSEYEERKAFEQYDEVDPRNRLVAAELEHRWNEKLQEVRNLKALLSEHDQESRILTEEEQEEILQLGEQFSAVWGSEHCPAPLKKKIIRTVVEEIIADHDEKTGMLSFTVHWKGGSHTRFEVPKPVGASGQKTAAEDVEIIRRMAVRYGDDEIARVLNMLGRRTGKGNRWSLLRVAAARRRASIPGQRATLENPEILTISGAARYCGVSTTTIKNLVAGGVLKKEQVVPWAPWEIKLSDLDTEPIQRILRRLKHTGKLVIEGDGLGGQRSLFITE